jgi:hypothetical protein
MNLGYVRDQRRQHAPQPQGLFGQGLAQIGFACAGGIAFVIDQVEDLQHCVEACGAVFGVMIVKADARLAEPALGTDDALLDRRFRCHLGARDFFGRQAADNAQG